MAEPRVRVVCELDQAQLNASIEIARKAAIIDDCGCHLVSITKHKALSLNKKGYVQMKVKDPNPNKKVQLHQLVCWMHPEPETQVRFRSAIRDGGLEISHLCKKKECMNPAHFVAESSAANKARNGCIATIRINGKFYPCCKHVPQCVPNAEDKATALEFFV